MTLRRSFEVQFGSFILYADTPIIESEQLEKQLHLYREHNGRKCFCTTFLVHKRNVTHLLYGVGVGESHKVTYNYHLLDHNFVKQCDQCAASWGCFGLFPLAKCRLLSLFI